MNIIKFQVKYSRQISDLILNIQNDEFAVAITLEEQPDLICIEDFYIKPGGDFLLAILDDQVVGTIGALKISESDYAIRKMFVNKDYRGSKYKIAQRLLDDLMDSFKSKNASTVYLGTINKYHAAIRFYSKNGFSQIDQDQLPGYFPVMKVDNVFFCRELDKQIGRFQRACINFLSNFQQRSSEQDFRIDIESLTKFEEIFCQAYNSHAGLVAHKQFTDELWSEIVEPVASIAVASTVKVGRPTLTPTSSEKSDLIILGIEEGLDCMIRLKENGDDDIESTSVFKGGMGANMAQAAIARGMSPAYLAFCGSGQVAKIQDALLAEHDISPFKVLTQEDTYLHLCILFGNEEFWLIPGRLPHSSFELQEYMTRVEEFCKENPGKPVVLTKANPRGSEQNFLERVAKIAHNNGCPVVYNTNQSADTVIVDKLLLEAGLDFLKPNLLEFLQVLVAAEIIFQNQIKYIEKQLEAQVKSGDFKLILELIVQLTGKYHIGILLISLGEYGALIRSENNTLHANGLADVKIQCSSGAGDTGLTEVLHYTKSNNINLKEPVKIEQLAGMLKSFRLFSFLSG